MIECAVLTVKGNAAQIEHRENIGVADFVLQAEPDQIEFAERRERFEAVQRQSDRAVIPLEVGPGVQMRVRKPIAGRRS